MKSYTSDRGKPSVQNPVDVPFEFDGVELTAHAPASGQWALFTERASQGGAESVRALLDLFRYILDDEDWEVIQASLEDGADVGVLNEIMRDLLEEWSTRPTPKPRASSASGKSTRKRSTAKSPSARAKTS